jgi:hypothetical protein
MQFLKKNIVLLLGLAIPVLMIAGVASAVYLPTLLVKPHTSFIYALGNYNDRFSVENGMIEELPYNGNSSVYQNQPQARLFFYDVETGKSHEVTLEEARRLHLSGDLESPDGFRVGNGTRSSGPYFLFDGSYTDYSSHYLIGHGVSKKLDISENASDYRNNFDFIGWVI